MLDTFFITHSETEVINFYNKFSHKKVFPRKRNSFLEKNHRHTSLDNDIPGKH